MANSVRQHIFFLDDEPGVCKAVSKTLTESGFEVSSFTDGADCLGQLQSGNCNLLISDLRMPGMCGLEVLRRAKRIAPRLPVLLITGYGDMATAVKAIKGGAADIISKPFGCETLLSKIQSILAASTVTQPVGESLTKKEMSVLKMIIDSRSTKEIAREFNRSPRTIEWHRYHIMRKFDVDNIVDLLKQAAQLGLVDLSQQSKAM